MKGKKQEKKNGYKSIKIKENHYEMVRDNKEKNGVDIVFFVGKAIEEKFQKDKIIIR